MRPKSRENRLGFRIGEHQCATTSRSAYSILSGAQCTGGREIAQPYPANYGAILGFHEPPKLGNRRLVGGVEWYLESLRGRRASKKRGVHRPHGYMVPGNSFPQICVVSGV